MSELGSLKFPEELKKLAVPELEILAEEIRQRIISVCLKNGGHIGASLGAVELSIALHRIFDSPKDKIIWDVGHQAYAHKLLTGREKEFDTLRKFEGMSGFLSRDESPHDVFGAGHSSTSISAALGISMNSTDWSIAVIGDGAITAGLALEALNNIRTTPKKGPLLVVLNDNQMSISENVGAIHQILNGGGAESFFSAFGLDYVGPVSGHHLGQLLAVLNGIKESKSEKPILIHVLTQKGKGYGPAETRPEKYHGVAPMKAPLEKTDPTPKAQEKSWSEVFSEGLIRLAEKDDRIHAVTAAMTDGTGLTAFERKFPARVTDVGIAEPHAVTFAAGLSTTGKRPVVAIYSTFLQRALDGMIHDVALQKLPVIFAVDRAGIVGADGPTHHGVFDLVYARMIPGLRIYTPEYVEDLDFALEEALQLNGPSLIRYPRGPAFSRQRKPTSEDLDVTGNVTHPTCAIISFGVAGRRIKSRPDTLHLHVIRSKPISERVYQELDRESLKEIYFVEDGSRSGGMGEGLLSELTRRNPKLISRLERIQNFGYPDEFIPHGTPQELEAWLTKREPARAELIQ